MEIRPVVDSLDPPQVDLYITDTSFTHSYFTGTSCVVRITTDAQITVEVQPRSEADAEAAVTNRNRCLRVHAPRSA